MAPAQDFGSEPPFDLDFHQLLVPKDRNKRKIAKPKSSESSSDASSFFIPEPLSRTNSVYSFTRVSLASQLSGLLSMGLPQAESLSNTITNLPTARKACRALFGAAEQINSWNRKALRMLQDLDGDDDVEWAAAAGKEALEETSGTINRFENLINIYVLAIEELQARPDVSSLRAEELGAVVEQMEHTLLAWDDVRQDLRKVHDQVEMAMEWEELWNTVLGEVGQELDALSHLVFEMEEKRHMAYINHEHTSENDNEQKIDINELENFIDEPKKKEQRNSRFSMIFETSPLTSPVVESPNLGEDGLLLSLFARMQPLRASLDFLPMRISHFETRASKLFPTACKELQDKRDKLEKSWTQLSDEAERLRRELSEDRWIVVFRNAGKQAQRMAESVERSVLKVQDAIDAGYTRSNPAALAKRVESFEAKKMHYMPAIQRVLTIIQKGLKDRLTVNGEILRLNKELGNRMRELEDQIRALSVPVDPVTARSNSRLRESISSMVSADRSTSTGTYAGTPGSSPPSSIDVPADNQTGHRPGLKYGLNGYTRSRPLSRPPPISANNRRVSLQPHLRPQTPLSSRRGPSPAPPSVYQQGVYRPPIVPLPPRKPEQPSDRPRWTSVVRSNETPATNKRASITPSSYYRMNPNANRALSVSVMGIRSPLSRETASSPIPYQRHTLTTPLNSRGSQTQLRSFADRIKSPDLQHDSSLLSPVPYSKSRTNPPAIRSPSSLAIRPATSTGFHKTPSTLRSSRLNPNVTPQSPMRDTFSFAQQSHIGSLDAILSTPIPTPSKSTSTRTNESDDSAVADLENEDPLTPPASYPTAQLHQKQDEYRGHTARTPSITSTSAISAHSAGSDRGARSTELGSSPLGKRNVSSARPPSSLSASGRGKRTSMLPVPRGRTGSRGMNSP